MHLHCHGTFSSHPCCVYFFVAPFSRLLIIRCAFISFFTGARDSVKLLTRPPPGRGSRTDGNSYLPPGKLDVVVIRARFRGYFAFRYAPCGSSGDAASAVSLSAYRAFDGWCSISCFFLFFSRHEIPRYCRLPVLCSGKHGNLFAWIIKDQFTFTSTFLPV